MHKYEGDYSIYDDVIESDLKDFLPEMIHVALYWDRYGLPTGKRNYLNGPAFHATATPGIDDILSSFDVLSEQILNHEEAWLLEIPVFVLKLTSIHAKTYLRGNGAAIALPIGIIGNLFKLNEFYFDLVKDELELSHSLNGELSINKRFISLLLGNWLFNDNGINDYKEHFEKIEHFLFNNFLNMKTESGRHIWVWTSTVIQQLFILFHEYGHLVNRDLHTEMKIGLMIEREYKADIWALNHLLSKLPYLLKDISIQKRIDDILLLFSSMRLISMYNEGIDCKCIAMRIDNISDYLTNKVDKLYKNRVQEIFNGLCFYH